MNRQEILEKLLIKPKNLRVKQGIYKHDKGSMIFSNAADQDLDYLLGLAGYTTQVQQQYFADAEDKFVLLIGKGECPKYECLWQNDEEYILDISEGQIVIIGKTAEGMILGLKALVRLHYTFENVPCMFISDYPDILFRSVHVCMFRPDDGTEKEESDPEYIKKMMKTAAMCGYNYVFIEFWGVFPYSMDYAHWSNAYSKAEIEDLVSYAMDKLHIRPLPAQNLTTHAGWSRITSRKHVVIDQRPDLAEMYIPGAGVLQQKTLRQKSF